MYFALRTKPNGTHEKALRADAELKQLSINRYFLLHNYLYFNSHFTKSGPQVAIWQ